MNPSVSDSTAVTDSPTVYITTLFLSVADSSAITDALNSLSNAWGTVLRSASNWTNLVKH